MALLGTVNVAVLTWSSPVLRLSPQDAIDLLLLQQPGTGGGYIFTSGTPSPLDGLQRVVVSGLAAPFVLDAQAAGTLYSSPVTIASFEEDSGRTNSSTLRIEANARYLVQSPGAIAEVAYGS